MIKVVRISNHIELTHVLFLDDVLMFGDGTFGNLQNLVKVLDSYQKATGMEINLEKLKLSQNNVHEGTLLEDKELIPVTTSPLS